MRQTSLCVTSGYDGRGKAKHNFRISSVEGLALLYVGNVAVHLMTTLISNVCDTRLKLLLQSTE